MVPPQVPESLLQDSSLYSLSGTSWAVFTRGCLIRSFKLPLSLGSRVIIIFKIFLSQRRDKRRYYIFLSRFAAAAPRSSLSQRAGTQSPLSGELLLGSTCQPQGWCSPGLERVPDWDSQKAESINLVTPITLLLRLKSIILMLNSSSNRRLPGFRSSV